MSPLERALNKLLKSNKKSAYLALFNNGSKLSKLFCNIVTSTHSTKISSGNKLEDFIYEEYKGLKFNNIKFVDVIKKIEENPNVTIVFKKVKISKSILI